MPSFRSRLFVFVLAHRHLLRGRLRRTTSIDDATDIQKLRDLVEQSAGSFGRLPRDFAVAPVRIGRLDAEWMAPPGADKSSAILYFHGGGLVVGSVRSHRGIVAKFVASSGVPALVFDYGLAPENPYPSGLNDAVAAYDYLLRQPISPERIVFIGDSGGGNLCLATLLALKEKGLPLPAGAVTLSAWTDLTNGSDSWVRNAKRDTLCWKEAQTVFAKMYAGDNDPTHPLISPVFGDLSGLPPLLMFAGEAETLCDDTVRFANRAEAAGVRVSLHLGAGLFHCYPACAPMFPEAVAAMKEIGAFVRRVTGQVEASSLPRASASS